MGGNEKKIQREKVDLNLFFIFVVDYVQHGFKMTIEVQKERR
jgi:hypothetical protein